MNRRFSAALLAGILTAAGVFHRENARAESARELVLRGNQAYERGDPRAALEAYRRAAAAKPEAAVTDFNQGAALYDLQAYKEAAQAFEAAALKAQDARLAAESLYNAGNAYFRSGEMLAEQNPQQGLAALEASAVRYREALERAPQLEQAAKNLELARRAMLRLREDAQKNAEKQAVEQQQQRQQQGQEAQPQGQEETQKELTEGRDAEAQQAQQHPIETPDDALQRLGDNERQSGSEQRPEERPAPAAESLDSGEDEAQKIALPDETREILEKEREYHKRRRREGAAEINPADKNW